jgi:hypothetical protein
MEQSNAKMNQIAKMIQIGKDLALGPRMLPILPELIGSIRNVWK